MNMRYLVVFSLCLLTLKNAVAEPYTFTEKDFIQYGIYFTAPRARTSEKLLEVKYGDIKGWYKAIAPQVSDKDIPATSQLLKVKTAQGSIRVNRRGNAGVTIVRDTHNEAKRVGTKRLEVVFENAECTDAKGVTSLCKATLVLTTKVPDKNVIRESRALSITTTTGLSFTFRSPRSDGSKPLNLPLLRRSPAISNYAFEWRPGKD